MHEGLFLGLSLAAHPLKGSSHARALKSKILIGFENCLVSISKHLIRLHNTRQQLSSRIVVSKPLRLGQKKLPPVLLSQSVSECELELGLLLLL